MVHESDVETRPSLVARLCDPTDQQAWEFFVQTYSPLLIRYSRRYGLQDADLTDLLQEILIKVAAAIRTFEYRSERGRFRDWLGAVVRSRLADFFRHKGRQLPLADPDAILAKLASPSSYSEWEAHFHDHLIRTALDFIQDEFEPETWSAFVQTWVHDQPPAKVAHDLGLSRHAVYVAKWRVLRRLREYVLVLADDAPW